MMRAALDQRAELRRSLHVLVLLPGGALKVSSDQLLRRACHDSGGPPPRDSIRTSLSATK